MSMYIERLRRASERDAEDEQARKSEEANVARERLVPLDDRLARLLSTIPVEVQREGIALRSIQAGLKGRWRGTCHPGELGAALRRAGFERRRRWTDVDGFRAVWRLLS